MFFFYSFLSLFSSSYHSHYSSLFFLHFRLIYSIFKSSAPSLLSPYSSSSFHYHSHIIISSSSAVYPHPPYSYLIPIFLLLIHLIHRILHCRLTPKPLLLLTPHIPPFNHSSHFRSCRQNDTKIGMHSPEYCAIDVPFEFSYISKNSIGKAGTRC